MLTLKLITEEKERVIEGLKKKCFKGAEEAIENVLAVDKKRRATQQELDANLAEQKKAAADKATERKNQALLFNQYLSVYNSLVSLVGNTLVALANMGSKNATAK